MNSIDNFYRPLLWSRYPDFSSRGKHQVSVKVRTVTLLLALHLFSTHAGASTNQEHLALDKHASNRSSSEIDLLDDRYESIPRREQSDTTSGSLAENLQVSRDASLLQLAPEHWSEQTVLEFLNSDNLISNDTELDTFTRRSNLSSDIDSSESDISTEAEVISLEEVQEQLQFRLESEILLDPNQVDINADRLSYDADRRVAVADGNASVQFADGTIIEGDRLLFYRDKNLLSSEGEFRFIQPLARTDRAIRIISGHNLNYDVDNRTATFEDAYTVFPG
ncbi:MAG: hypothetical protein AAGA75_13170 [Cyanobacteria bacterium P01_E01_bin.6]